MQRAATATVAIRALLRAPRTGGARPPHVGTGQAESGDVCAIRLADDRWVTAYVHGEALTNPRR